MLSLVAFRSPPSVAVRKLWLCPNYGFSFGLNLKLAFGIAEGGGDGESGLLQPRWPWIGFGFGFSGWCCCLVSGLLHSNLVSNIICVKWRNKRFGRRIRCVAYKCSVLPGGAHTRTATPTPTRQAGRQCRHFHCPAFHHARQAQGSLSLSRSGMGISEPSPRMQQVPRCQCDP